MNPTSQDFGSVGADASVSADFTFTVTNNGGSTSGTGGGAAGTTTVRAWISGVTTKPFAWSSFQISGSPPTHDPSNCSE